MTELDPVLLARIQFAMTIMFHFIFPPVSIGLAWMLVAMETLGWRRGEQNYITMAKFFGKLFAVTFAVGVASGIVMEFQFGMNWARYSEFVGDIFGAPLAAEGIFAFFLESSFLGLYFFGRDKVSKGVHLFSCFMVAFGATMSAFWILVANSWQQTPAGHVFNEETGRAELVSFMDAVFNPSTLPRNIHQLNACMITGAFMVVGVAAYLLLKDKESVIARKAMKIGLIFAVVNSFIAILVTGHLHATQVAETQPAKLASMEGLMETRGNAPLLVFGIPVEKGPGELPEVKYRVEIPSGLSLLVHNDPEGVVTGLNDIPAEDRPPFAITFLAFHMMVGLGSIFVGLACLAAFMYWRGKLWDAKWLLWSLVAAIPLPILCNQFGWITAEVGRQPWIVYGLLRTKDAHSTTVPAEQMLIAMFIFGCIYLFLGAMYLFLMVKKVKAGPEAVVGPQKEVTA